MKFFVVLGIFAALAMLATFADETNEITTAGTLVTATEVVPAKNDSSSQTGTLYIFPCKWQWST